MNNYEVPPWKCTALEPSVIKFSGYGYYIKSSASVKSLKFMEKELYAWIYFPQTSTLNLLVEIKVLTWSIIFPEIEWRQNYTRKVMVYTHEYLITPLFGALFRWKYIVLICYHFNSMWVWTYVLVFKPFVFAWLTFS